MTRIVEGLRERFSDISLATDIACPSRGPYYRLFIRSWNENLTNSDAARPSTVEPESTSLASPIVSFRDWGKPVQAGEDSGYTQALLGRSRAKRKLC